MDDEIIKQYINGVANMEEKSVIKKSKKSRVLVFYGKNDMIFVMNRSVRS